MADQAFRPGTAIGDSGVLLVVDVQNDFCPGGKLPVPHGDEVVPVVNRLAAKFPHVVLTQDWHPPGHFSFASTHAVAIDSYSAFFENDHRTPTGLTGYLHERGLSRVVLVGLALDFCVRYSAEDAHAQGFDVIVVEDACRAIDIDGSLAATRRRLGELGVATVKADDFA